MDRTLDLERFLSQPFAVYFVTWHCQPGGGSGPNCPGKASHGEEW